LIGRRHALKKQKDGQSCRPFSCLITAFLPVSGSGLSDRASFEYTLPNAYLNVAVGEQKRPVQKRNCPS
jgi:hypothetical protein